MKTLLLLIALALTLNISAQDSLKSDSIRIKLIVLTEAKMDSLYLADLILLGNDIQSYTYKRQ
jgi:hypothetical protein